MIKIGILGMSAGNAHPSSWSAIINGQFNGEEISKMGFPAVTDYLHANRDTLGLPGALVTHVWSQSRQISRQIARTAGVAGVVNTMEEMIGKVDAVILARDDGENHVEMARPFIEAGIPLFIDKPLCCSRKDLDYFREAIARGKFIMSGSSMRYATECRSAKAELKSLGDLELVTAVGKKDWMKYGIHMLEAIFSVLDDPRPVSVRNIGRDQQDIVAIEFESGLQAVLHLFMNVAPTFQISLYGRAGWRLVEIKDSYSMFRNTIIEFIRSVQEGAPRIDFSKTERIISVLIAAKESLKLKGKKINL